MTLQRKGQIFMMFLLTFGSEYVTYGITEAETGRILDLKHHFITFIDLHRITLNYLLHS